MVAWAR